jgi:hypothetical protein
MIRRLIPVVLLAAFALEAELPPSAYRKWQMEAPEALEILVKKASPVVAMKTTTVEVEAEVLRVLKTSTGLKPGSKIHITYTHEVYERAIAGPSPIPLLHTGDKVPAFLSRGAKGLYEPAARGRSFSAAILQ